MKKFYCTIIIAILNTLLFAAPEEKGTYTKVGDKSPVTKATNIDGELLPFKNKVVVLSLFATWCPPCRKEMPELQKLWSKHKHNKDLLMLAAGREEDSIKLSKFKKSMGLDFHIAPDEKRKIFSKFAKMNIPRLYLIDRQGTIIFQSIGYEEKEFQQMIKLLEKELKSQPQKK